MPNVMAALPNIGGALGSTPQSLARLSQMDIIGAMMIVWMARGKIIRSILCSIVCNSCTQ